jgi:hypothetical protein
MTNLILTLFAVGVAIGLAACGGKKNASSPSSSCKYNAAYQDYVDSQGRSCGNYNTSNCLNQGYRYDNGQWYNASNNVVYCNDGGLNWNQDTYLPGNINSYGYGCDLWTRKYARYGARYVPVDAGNGRSVCININMFAGNTAVLAYYDQYGYDRPLNYWAADDYRYRDRGCGTSISVGVNFGDFGVGGYFCP